MRIFDVSTTLSAPASRTVATCIGHLALLADLVCAARLLIREAREGRMSWHLWKLSPPPASHSDWKWSVHAATADREQQATEALNELSARLAKVERRALAPFLAHADVAVRRAALQALATARAHG